MAKTKKSNVFTPKPKRKYTKKAKVAETITAPEVVPVVAATFEEQAPAVVETAPVVVETPRGLSAIPEPTFEPAPAPKKKWWKFW